VLSWNRLHYLRATLASARRCLRYPEIEWIVSDNESNEPGLREHIESCDWVSHRIFKSQTHAEAMNQIVDMAGGEYLILWPDDMQFVVEGEWLADLVEILGRHPEIGSVSLDGWRNCTIGKFFGSAWYRWLPHVLGDLYLYRHRLRRPRVLASSSGYKLSTFGWRQSGICGSGIPSLTRTAVWRALGPWKARTDGATDIVDSSLGAEEAMYRRFVDSRLPLHSATPLVPVAADIITDPTGCKAKVRGRYRYGIYMPAQSADGLYYRIRRQEEFVQPPGPAPLGFNDLVEPIGFRIPTDAQGDRLKSSINLSVVFDTRTQTEVRYPLTLP
jgi:hypothetical protein